MDLLAHPGFIQRFRPRVVSTTLALAWVAAGKRAGYVTDGGDLTESVHFAAGIALCKAADLPSPVSTALDRSRGPRACGGCGRRDSRVAVVDDSRSGLGSFVVAITVTASILTGVRVSTQMLMGIAAIAAFASWLGLGNQIFCGISSLGSANTLNEVQSSALGIVVPALPFDAGYVLFGRLTISRGIRG